MFRFLSLQPRRPRLLDVHRVCRRTIPVQIPRCLWCLRKPWSNSYALGHYSMVYYLSITVCFYFLRPSRGWLADGFIKAQIWINGVDLFLTPSLLSACVLPEVYWVFPLMMRLCVWDTWSFFFGHKLRGVKYTWKHSPFGVSPSHSW